MARIFVQPKFTASRLDPNLFEFLLTDLDDDIIVMLEFHSKGRQKREIDLAVLGPYGIDVVEIKDKWGGRVVAQPNGPWHIIKDNGRKEEIPLNGSRRENPYDQVDVSANDLNLWLRHDKRLSVKLFPAVLIPQGRPDASIKGRGYIYGINGVENLRGGLRSLYSYLGSKPCWDYRQYERIPEALGLVEMGLAFVQGTVIDQGGKQALSGVEVELGDIAVTTDRLGKFDCVVRMGETSVRVTPQEPYVGTEFSEEFLQGANRDVEIKVSKREVALPTEANASEPGPAFDTTALGEELRKVRARLEKEQAEREALYELVLEATGERQVAEQSSSTEVSGRLDDLKGQLAEIQKALGTLNQNEDTTDSEKALETSLVLLKNLASNERPAAEQPQPSEPAAVSAADWQPTNRSRPLLSVFLPIAALVLVSVFVLPRFLTNAPVVVVPEETTTDEADLEKPVSPVVNVVSETRADSDAPDENVETTRSSTSETATPQADDVIAEETEVPTPNPVENVPEQESVRATPDKSEPSLASSEVTETTPTPKPIESVPARKPVAPSLVSVDIETASPTPAPITTQPEGQSSQLPGELASATAATESGPPTTKPPLPGQPVAAAIPSREGGVEPVTRYDCPQSYPIKANINFEGERIYHMPKQDYYQATAPEACFAIPPGAEAAGFRRSQQ